MNDLNAKKEELVKQFEGLDSTFSEIKMLMTYYECAILEVKTKLDVLNKFCYLLFQKVVLFYLQNFFSSKNK